MMKRDDRRGDSSDSRGHHHHHQWQMHSRRPWTMTMSLTMTTDLGDEPWRLTTSATSFAAYLQPMEREKRLGSSTCDSNHRFGPPDISDTPALGQWCLTGRAPGPGENTTPIEDSAKGTGERAAPASDSMKLSLGDPLMMVTGIGPDTGESLGSTNQCPENPSGGVCFIAGVDTPRCRCHGTGGGVGVRVVLPAPPLSGQGAAQAWSRGTLQLIRKRRPPCLGGGSRRLACRVWERR
ncbi:hypothetical protein ACOMHN_053627 [Nucella lapillus]